MASFWPSTEDQAVLTEFFEEYPLLAPGMCYLFGVHRQAGLSREDAAQAVRDSVESLPLEEPS